MQEVIDNVMAKYHKFFDRLRAGPSDILSREFRSDGGKLSLLMHDLVDSDLNAPSGSVKHAFVPGQHSYAFFFDCPSECTDVLPVCFLVAREREKLGQEHSALRTSVASTLLPRQCYHRCPSRILTT